MEGYERICIYLINKNIQCDPDLNNCQVVTTLKIDIKGRQ